MNKIRVHELAKELGIGNKELLAFLAKKNIIATSHMSSLTEEVANAVRKSIKEESTPAPARTDAASEKQPEEKKSPLSKPVKGKNIVRVFRPQNARNALRFESSARRHPRMSGAGAGFFRPHLQTAQRPVQGQTGAGRPKGAGSMGTAKTEGRPSRIFPEKEYRPTGKVLPQGEKIGRGTGMPAQTPTRGAMPKEELQRRRVFGQPTPQAKEIAGKTPTREQKLASTQAKEGLSLRKAFSSYRRERNFSGESKAPHAEEQRGARFEEKKERDQERRGRAGAEISAAQVAEQQKAQRNKAKAKQKDFKNKGYKKEVEFEEKSKRRRKEKSIAEIQKRQPKVTPKKEEKIKMIVLPEMLTLKEFADKMKVLPSVIIKKLFLQGKNVTVNDEINYDEAEEIALGFDVLCEKEKSVDVIEELLKEGKEDEKAMVKRPPVVCVMGHVDHGKTSLLDAIRHTNVTKHEAGGITQRIGAYVVDVNGESITFLDTPGHEAFTAMRMRGANSTDIAVLVVAADDGVMPQTIEAINHAKAAGIEIIVAINKIDKRGANVERVKQELADQGLVPEDWGGHTICVPVSALTKEGIPELLDMILLSAEMMELKANPNRSARGVIIEAKLDRGKGCVATVLVQKGTLHIGDAVAAGFSHGKVRTMMDETGCRVEEAGPSKPVEISGLNEVPNAGDVFVCCESEKDARNFAETFISQNKVKLLKETKSKMSLDDLFNQIKQGDLKELNILIKADGQGSVEALKQSLLKLSNDEVVIKIIHGGVGAINESDVLLASASNAVIIGFNVRPDATAKETAKNAEVDIRLYRVIYNAIDDVKAAMKGMLEPIFEEKVLGHAEVRQTFKASGVGTIAGAYILDGVFERSCKVRLTRGGIVMFDGPLASLKRFKDDVKEVKAGFECGFVFENYNDIQDNDLVEAYKMVEVERT